MVLFLQRCCIYKLSLRPQRNKMHKIYPFISLVSVWLMSLLAFGQTDRGAGATLSGQVTDGRQPLAGAVLTLEPSGEVRYTDEQGRFRLTTRAERNQTLSISLLGKQPVLLTWSARRDSTLIVTLEDRSFGLSEVSVVAKEQRIGSSSVIDKSALIHVQPTSLADVLQLVPGQLAANPNLSGPQQVTLRQVPTGADALRANALGTAVVQDGVPVSNNANLQSVQTILNSTPGALPPFSSVVGRGNDLRQIGADNIESVEVVRGIPSARYGDLTSGLVIVNSRIGVVRPEVRVRLNPNLAQAAFVSGFQVKPKQILNASVDILRAQDDPRDRLNTYTRLTGQLAWKRQARTLTTTTILAGYRTLDDQKRDPSDTRSQRVRFARDESVKFSTEGRWRPNKAALTSLRYVAALTYTNQQAFTQELVTRDLFPLSNALTDTTLRGRYGEAEYLSQYRVSGRPLNGYANWEAGWVLPMSRQFTHLLVAGMEWRMDVNLGEGRVFDPTRPPRQNYSVGERPRDFRTIPALHQLSYYVEDKLTGQLGNRTFVVQAGFRLDNVQPRGPFSSRLGTIPAPRLNVALETLPGLFVRAGYGMTAKAPTIDVLYPGPRFFDLVNVNYFARDPAERFLLMTTRVIDLDGQRIRPYRSEKLEVGIDGQVGGFSGAITAFRETTTGAFGTNREAIAYSLARYGIAATPTGLLPVLTAQPTRYDTVFVGYDRPVANRRYENRGIEFSILTPDWSAIRTSFQLNGAWIRSNSVDDGTITDTDRAITGTSTPRRVAIYQSAANRTATRFNTSLRFIHRIPSLKLVVSALWQTIWHNSNQSNPLNINAIGYLNRQNTVVNLAPEQGASAEFADLRRVINPQLTIPFDPPPLHLVNLRVTKEWAKGYGFSFYANNLTGHRPLVFNPQSAVMSRLNEPLFFAAEINISL